MRCKILVPIAVMLGVSKIQAQTFNSGSNGSDGALNLATPGTILFDPRALNLDADGDNVYHFTTINIGPGVIVKLRANLVPGPVFWLAQGTVTIAGTIDLNGENGHPSNSLPAARVPSVAGAGGYSGGVGKFGANLAQPGAGPGGGLVFPIYQGGQNFPYGSGGNFTGNAFLVPLIGGSGGGGSPNEESNGGAGGGAGGGAITIASSTSILVNGLISATGGTCGGGLAGGGSGGGIRLAAPTIGGSGSFSTLTESSAANACSNGRGPGGAGITRLEAFQQNFTGGTIKGTFFRATPFNTFLPSGQSSVKVLTVGGVAVPPNPTGSFSAPDVTLNSTAAVLFAIEARNIPTGTVVKLQIFSETGADLTIDSSPLVGTPQVSSASASAILPSGFSRGFVRATWVQ